LKPSSLVARGLGDFFLKLYLVDLDPRALGRPLRTPSPSRGLRVRLRDFIAPPPPLPVTADQVFRLLIGPALIANRVSSSPLNWQRCMRGLYLAAGLLVVF